MAGTLTLSTLSDGTNSTNATDVIRGSARAWVNFNGTGTVAIRASYNVSSITDNGTGDYTINFTNAMPDANYSFACNVWGYEASPPDSGTPLTTTSLRMQSYYVSGTSGQRVNWDATQASVVIFR